MKRHIFVALAALTLLFFGFQTAFCQVDTDLRGNTAPSEALPEDLKDLDVKDYFIAPEAEPIGLIQTVTGHVVVLHGETNEAYFAAQGDAVFQQDALFTLEESRCRVKFVSEDVITMGEDARIDIEELVDDHELQKKKSSFNMLRGKAMFYVVPLFRYKNISASVKTKTAVAGIRGTKFGVEVRKAKGSLAQSEPLYIADASNSGLFYLAQANNDTETVVYAFEGEVDVYSPIDGTTQKVSEGETVVMTTVGAGIVKPTPPATAQQFMQETEAPAPAEEEETAAEEKPPAVKEAAPVTTGTDTTTSTTDTGNTDVTQDQTATSVEETASTSETRPSTHYGYFSSMLTDRNMSTRLDNLYASSSRQNFDSSLVQATGIADTTGYMKAYPGSGFSSSSWLTEVAVSYPSAVSGTLDSSYTICHTELGFNAYQEWGYWTMTARAIEINSYNHYVDNKAFYMVGDYTPNSAVSGVSGHYTGTAWGTYWEFPAVAGSTAGTDMTGTFYCDVDGAASTNQITGFTLSVTGGGHSAGISTGTGSFSPGTSDFSLSSPTCTIDGSTASGALSGGLYGPNGEYIGGAGGIYNSSTGEGVNVLFQGSK